MGASTSSLLDDSKSSYIRGRTEAELKNFSPHYRRQYLVTFFSQLQDEVEQHKTGQPQLLKQRVLPDESEVVYKENVLYYEDTRKWKERFVVVRGNYSLECHDSTETFAKGVPPRLKLETAGGSVLTSQEKYTTLVDKAFPDPNGSKDEPPTPMVAVPGSFPVYLHLPYRKDVYFSFDQEDSQTCFVSVLTDCVRHQSHDFLKRATCDVQAFLKAIHFYRQEKGHYESWDMLVGSDVQVLANLVMEELLPSLQTELLPRLKGKKVEKKRLWFMTVAAAYLLVQDQLSQGLTTLKDECQVEAKKQEGLIRADMDQIVNSKTFLAGKLQALVSEPASKFCTENVQPYLASILEELMVPVSLGFQEARLRCERHMNSLCKEVQEKGAVTNLAGTLDKLGGDELQDCYQHMEVLSVQLQELRNRFKFSNAVHLVQRAQVHMQQVVQNAAHTFELLLQAAVKENAANPSTAVEKAKQRVLKQYDYDSSTVRKRIFQEALLDITFPALQRSLAPSCKPELQAFDQYIFADHTNFIQVENVYEDILLQTLDSEISKVVREAASMKKHNLFVDSTDFPFVSQASLSESRTPPTSPGYSTSKVSVMQTQPPPLLGNGDVEMQEPPAPGEADGVDAAGPAHSPLTTALQESVMDTDTSPSTPAPLADTDTITAAEVASLEEKCVPDEAVHLEVPSETNVGAEIPLESSTETRGDGAAAAADGGIKLDSSVSPDVADDNHRASPQPVSETEEDGAGPHHLAAQVTKSATLTPESTLAAAEGCSEPSASVAVREENAATSPSAQILESNTDQTEDLKGSGEAPTCRLTTEDGQASGSEEPAFPSSGTSAGDPHGGAVAPGAELSHEDEEEPLPDSVRDIRDLLVEVIEVEELVYKTPPGGQA